jgi:hypothetical protein
MQQQQQQQEESGVESGREMLMIREHHAFHFNKCFLLYKNGKTADFSVRSDIAVEQ